MGGFASMGGNYGYQRDREGICGGLEGFQEDILVGDMFGSGEERVWLWGELGRIRVSNASRQKKGSPCFLP